MNVKGAPRTHIVTYSRAREELNARVYAGAACETEHTEASDGRVNVVCLGQTLWLPLPHALFGFTVGPMVDLPSTFFKLFFRVFIFSPISLCTEGTFPDLSSGYSDETSSREVQSQS